MSVGWKYYNHAAIPSTLPHESVNLKPIEDGSIWAMKGRPLLARWTTEFDCGHQTNWWYVIKDTPFNVSELKAKRRYEINKGKKYFTVSEIATKEYVEALYDITVAAYSGWNKKYRPRIEREVFCTDICRGNWDKVLGIFSKQTDQICGYALLSKNDNVVNFNVLRVRPDCEKYGINAAAVAAILEIYEDLLLNRGYICDGERSVNHETCFQDYLQKYFGFRKAYCKMHICYNPKIKWLTMLLNLFKPLLHCLDCIGFVHMINAVLKMQELSETE